MADLPTQRYPILRTALRALGLQQDKIDQVVQYIVELLEEPNLSGSSPDLEAFRLRDDFLSPTEKSFFRILRDVVGCNGAVFIKTRLGDLFYPCRGDYGERVGLRNRVDRKHLDFLVCRPDTLEPWFGVELDDSSHERVDRQERDALVNQVFASARLPLLRVLAKQGYSRQQLLEQLQQITGFGGNGTPKMSVAPEGTSQVKPLPENAPTLVIPPGRMELDIVPSPRCPKCQGEMILRTARSGKQVGNSFWGCSNFPCCRGTALVDPGATTKAR